MFKGVAAAVAVAGAMWAGQASATIVVVTYTGLTSGSDGAGLFGTPGATYKDVAFTTQYRFNETDLDTDPGAFLSADLTVNGLTFSMSGSGYRGADASVDGYMRLSEVAGRFAPLPFPAYHSYIVMGNHIETDAPDGRTDAFSGVGTNIRGMTANYFGLEYGDPVISRENGASFGFNTQTVEVTSMAGEPSTGPGVWYRSGAGAIPEPATWSMMLLGLFGLGSVLRAGRRESALAAY